MKRVIKNYIKYKNKTCKEVKDVLLYKHGGVKIIIQNKNKYNNMNIIFIIKKGEN